MVYGHGNGTLKSSFYDAFITTSIGIFTARDRPTHTRKRKIISHTFSQKSVLEFEPHVHRYVGQLLGQWDKLYDKALKGISGEEGEGWTGRDEGFGWIACRVSGPPSTNPFLVLTTSTRRGKLSRV